MEINIISVAVGFSPTLYPRLLPVGNPFKYHVVALYL